jgi:hypothetical protein
MKLYRVVLLGSAEGFTLAEQTINTAAKQGNWVLLKNVHLAPQWLKELEKKLHSIKPHESFRLFLSTEIHPKVLFLINTFHNLELFISFLSFLQVYYVWVYV